MPHRAGWPTRLAVGLLWFLAVGVQAQAPGDNVGAAGARQDGRYIRRLEWVSPHGELPGTYAEYLEQHPLSPAHFAAPKGLAAGRSASPRLGSISILVDATLWPAIQTALETYLDELAAEGYSTYVATVSGGTPAEIKAWVQQQYNAGAEGIVFIGDITAAWAEVSGDVFPCDLFYMDLDGYWEDADSDGDYETHTAGGGDEGPEVYLARVYAHTLTYGTEPDLVNGYFAKVHSFRLGQLTQPWRGLEYVDEDWFDMLVHLNLIYDDVTRYDFGYFTTAADYLAQMDLGQHFVQVCAHSYSGGHHFGKRPTEAASYAHVYVHSPTPRTALLRLGSDDGIKVWWNGVNVLTKDVYQGWTPDKYSAWVSLDAGWNRLLCKVSQGGGSYQFSAQLTDPNYANFPDLTYQINDPTVYGPEAPFVRGWLLNGFHQDSSGNFWNYLNTNYLGVSEAGLNPQAGEVNGGKTWTQVNAWSAYVDMDAYSNQANFGVVYAFVRLYAQTDKACQLWLGYDDGVRVWLNGQQVLYDNRYGTYVPDMTKLDVTLKAGQNRLLVKVSEWMGAHGFSLRLTEPDGSPPTGVTYDPVPPPISYLGLWLINGPYANADPGTRLTTDYLGGEATVRPSEGDPAPMGVWTRAIGSGYPFDLGVAFDDDGGWVFSQDVQDRDPPVLFYNLFACGPGRFTDQNYLAGAYIFNTTYGLITVASSKSGSMLNFDDFTQPLGQGRTIGQAFRAWFDAQAPYALWEREWYYGMILNGDPTLRPTALARVGDLNCDRVVDFGDINPFVLILSDPSAWQAAYPGCPLLNGDCNGDGQVNFADINPFVALLSSSQ